VVAVVVVQLLLLVILEVQIWLAFENVVLDSCWANFEGAAAAAL
jgi:hypothetical protein